MFYTDDPISDADKHFAEKEKELDNLPRCSCCNEPIQQEKAICYNDQWCCEGCEFDFWHDIRDDFLESVNEDG